MEKLRDMWLGKNISGVEETEKTGILGVGDHSPANKHEPLDSSHGARIMAKEVGVVFLMFLRTMNLAPHTKQTAISYNDRHNMEQNVSKALDSSEMNLIQMYLPAEGFVFIENITN